MPELVAQSVAGIILCGGQSRRMGQPKCHLPWQQTSLLDHVVRQMAPVCGPLVIATAAELVLPAVSHEVIVQRDVAAYQGPLAGLITGFLGVPLDYDAALVTACDLPFVTTKLLQRLLELWSRHSADALLCSDGQRAHPLLGVYRRTVVPIAEQMLAHEQRRLLDLFPRVTTVLAGPEDLQDLDPELLCLRNLNSPADYAAALQQVSQFP